MTAPLLAFRDVHHNFRGLQVLKGVHMDIAQGAFVGLIGPNGAGKSTLFNIASGFLPPTSGSVMLDGQEIGGMSVQERSRRGLVRTFQTPQVFRNMTVLENLMVGVHKQSQSGTVGNLFLSPRSRRELRAAHQAANAALERFGLGDVAHSIAGTLPGGLQRMLELGRACVGMPRLLLLDEPSSGLNTDEILRLTQVLRTIHEQRIAILLVSHDMELMASAQRIHVLCFGEIIAVGSMDEVRANVRVRDAYLGT